MIDQQFRQRFSEESLVRPDDQRDEYQRDRARIIHSAAFRRLQGKTQVMGVGEGDFHRTRLTHSIEAGQIGEGILCHLQRKYSGHQEISDWLPSQDLIGAACYSHDLGHPPFGHAGEMALQTMMFRHGGFEGNGQTLRILLRLEKYEGGGINPTRRLVTAILKYPRPYSAFNVSEGEKPPKCYFDTECQTVDWALSEPFLADERYMLLNVYIGW